MWKIVMINRVLKSVKVSSLHRLQNHIVWKSRKADASIISRMHRLSTEEMTRMGMYNLGEGERRWHQSVRFLLAWGSNARCQSLALSLHRWGTTSQGSQSPLAEQLSHVHWHDTAIIARTHNSSFCDAFACACVGMPHRCTYMWTISPAVTEGRRAAGGGGGGKEGGQRLHRKGWSLPPEDWASRLYPIK